LFNGDLVVGNTADNLLVEISSAGEVVATQHLDTGAVGALFGVCHRRRRQQHQDLLQRRQRRHGEGSGALNVE
jgi:hypothetical protein